MGQLLSVLYFSSAAAVLSARFGEGDFIEMLGWKIELGKTCNAQCALNLGKTACAGLSGSIFNASRCVVKG